MTSPAEPPAVEDAQLASGRMGGELAVLAAVSVVAGLVAAVAWRLIVRLPGYVVRPDGSASVTERSLTEFFAADAWFGALGALVGVGLGIVTWTRLKNLGWRSPFIAAAAGLVAAVICWRLGELLGGVAFDDRLAAARPGDFVPISLQLRSPSVLALWAFAAVGPILLGSALGPDDEAPPRVRVPVVEPRTDENEAIDDRGVVRGEERNQGAV